MVCLRAARVHKAAQYCRGLWKVVVNSFIGLQKVGLQGVVEGWRRTYLVLQRLTGIHKGWKRVFGFGSSGWGCKGGSIVRFQRCHNPTNICFRNFEIESYR